MANTLTAIIPSIFAGLDEVSREIIGLIPAVARNTAVERAAVGQAVTVPIVPAATTGNITPAAVPPDDGDVVIGSLSMSITKSKYSAVRWNGEEQLAIGPMGQYNKLLSDQFAQAFRVLANEVEADIATAAIQGASRAYGTAGTAPFGTAGDLTDFAGLNQILDANGAPLSGRVFVASSGARFNLEGKQSVLFKVNEAGTDGLLRQRVIQRVMGFDMGFSSGMSLFDTGTGASYLVNAVGGYAVGATAITVDTGTGTIPKGSVITFAGDTNKYVVATALAANVVTLAAPGLRAALADNTAITVLADYTASVAFSPNSLLLAARAPALPAGGDSADDRMFVQDPISGIQFEVSLYREYRRMRYEVALAWGVSAVKSAHIALLLG